MFPLNTDGIDPSGRNILIQNITCENYDDVVAVKPGKLLTDGCTQNMTVDNAKVILGVGMIGSVPPNTDINCFRDVWFRNVEFIRQYMSKLTLEKMDLESLITSTIKTSLFTVADLGGDPRVPRIPPFARIQ